MVSGIKSEAKLKESKEYLRGLNQKQLSAESRYELANTPDFKLYFFGVFQGFAC